MTTESELVDLLDAIGDRAPAAEAVLSRLAFHDETTGPARQRWVPLGAALMAAAAVAACVLVAVEIRADDDGTHGTAAARPSADVPTLQRATYPLPLDGYSASATQERTLQRAQFALAQRCASARGVTVAPAKIPTGDLPAEFLSTVADNIRPLTLTQAETIGYDLYRSGPSASDAVVAKLTPQQRQIYAGWYDRSPLPRPHDPFLLSGGCVGQAERTLLAGATPAPLSAGSGALGVTVDNHSAPGLFDDDATVHNVYVNDALVGEDSPAVRQAQTRWASCMAAHGYPGLRSTLRAIRSIHDLRSQAAKDQASQDVRCKQSTGFMTVWVASMTAAQNNVIDAHRAQLAGFKQRLATPDGQRRPRSGIAGRSAQAPRAAGRGRS